MHYFAYIIAAVLFLYCNATDQATTATAAVPKDPKIIFALPFEFHDVNGDNVSITLNLREGDSPHEFAREIARSRKLDKVAYHWILRTFQHSIGRLNDSNSPPVFTLEVKTEHELVLESLVVRYGDDLALLARTYSFQQGLDFDKANEIYQQLLAAVPQHTSIEWIDHRKSQSTSDNQQAAGTNIVDRLQEPTVRAAQRDRYAAPSTQSPCELSVGIVSRGNIAHLSSLVQAFPETNLVCEVIVIVEGTVTATSAEDRARLVNAYPSFNIVFQSQLNTAATESFATLTKMAKSRYLLYLDEDWNILATDDQHLRLSLEVLKANSRNSKALVQIALNDIDCKYGPGNEADSAKCAASGGWRRAVTYESGEKIEYEEIEFGSMYPEHGHRSPGFALVPSIIDVNVVDTVDLVLDGPGNMEEDIALNMWEGGLVVGFLPGVANYKVMTTATTVV